MLDIKIIRNNPDLVKDIIEKRNLKLDLVKFLEIDSKKLELIVKVDELREIKNKVSKEIPTLSNDERPEKIAEMKKLGDELKLLEEEQSKVEESWKELYYQIPNLLDETASIWNTDEDNKAEEYFLEPTKFDFTAKPHYEIGEAKWWIDTDKGSEVSWARFWYLKWDLVLLQFALINYAMTKLVSEWFNPILPPVLVREKAMFWTWFFPAGEDGLYRVNQDDDDLHLVWTSEVPVTSYHCWETMDLENLKCMQLIVHVLEEKHDLPEKIWEVFWDDINLIRLKWFLFVNQKNLKKCMILWYLLKKISGND